MSARPPRGKGFRGSGRGHYGGHWMGHRGGGGYRGGGRGGGYRGRRPDHYHGNQEMHSPHRPHDPEKLLSNLGPEAQLALTTAIINSVLKTDGREGHSSFRDRDYHSRRGGSHHGGRGGYFWEESRERRHFGEDRRSHESRLYHDEGRGHHYEREKPTSGSPRYRNNRYPAMPRRRPSPHGHLEPSRKRQRIERMDSMEGDSPPHHDHQYNEEKGPELGREKLHERKSHSPGQNRERKGLDGDSRDEEKEDGPDKPGGVQVTIRSDGERAVNNEGRGRPRVAGRLFVELRCPHCPNQRSITFKEYKYHLSSEEHKDQLNRLSRKHSVVLRKIRMQQRQKQRDIETKWKEEQGGEFKSSVTRFCNTCKLAYKCLGGNTGEGVSFHNSSKLHRMQKCYLYPRCSMCQKIFQTRMVYEYHIASISHLRVRTAAMDGTGGSYHTDDQEQEEEVDELDLANFMTLDSVGEDDEGSEHEEITGGLDEMEALKEAESRRKQSLGTGYKSSDSLDYDEVSLEPDWDKDQLEDDEVEGNEAVGTEYVRRIKAYQCSLCSKMIRANTCVGSRAIQRHCRSLDHLTHYHDVHPTVDENITSEDDVEKGPPSKAKGGKVKQKDGHAKARTEMEDDLEQEKLWEEVDKGLNMLQGEIMTEIDDSCPVAADENASKDGDLDDSEEEITKADPDECDATLDELEEDIKYEEEAKTANGMV